MAVRRVPKNYRNVTGIMASRKAAAPADFESTLERDFLTLLEFSPQVRAFDVQPVTVTWREAGRERRYTPDVLVHYESGSQPELYEVKYRQDLWENWKVLRPKIRAGVHFAKAQGWRFRLATEVEIRTPYLENAKFLLAFARLKFPPESCAQLLLGLRELRETSPAGLLLAICRDETNRALMTPALWHLLGTFRIGTDLHRPLTMDSRIWSKE